MQLKSLRLYILFLLVALGQTGSCVLYKAENRAEEKPLPGRVLNRSEKLLNRSEELENLYDRPSSIKPEHVHEVEKNCCYHMSCLLILIYYVEPISYGCFVLYLAAARIFPTFAKKCCMTKRHIFKRFCQKAKRYIFYSALLHLSITIPIVSKQSVYNVITFSLKCLYGALPRCLYFRLGFSSHWL